MQAYGASLTNAAGKVLEPETIIAGQSSQASRSTKIVHKIKSTKAQKQANETSSNGCKKPRNPTKKGGKAAALEAAANLKKSKYKQIMSNPNVELRYTLARTYIQNLDMSGLRRQEIELFMIDCLLRIWTDSNKSKDTSPRLDISALIWGAHLRLSKVEVGMTVTIIAALQTISKALELLEVTFQNNCSDRTLAFSYMNVNILTQKYGDAWQRKVLDAIDKEESLIVVAPTSSGKTFISFYAMKKILQASDDNVAICVAPTKALLNPIAAEIQARFSKAFRHPGRSIWGIHTRDFCINNPTGSQILVILPHVLQIM
ncbi:hypothetical protein M501DRAFT_1059989 [Patellaria atrata CBS 101060]|uniref:DEAD/DEAH-box helicase domain-containing protein n=1 Tax=Patellaria atrata CBS 101060 TaxID=1346257 RepID=A0A9P4S6I0_9PEZI|nr:hypothetical protein M501DRAFT_1059989 [Patellaria atrata CBS 101060]